MANEITVSFVATIENGSFKETISPGRVQYTQTGKGCAGHTQVIGTTDELIDIGDLTAEGWCYLRNLSTTNYIAVGPSSGGSDGSLVEFIKLAPGEFCWLPLWPTCYMMARAEDSGSDTSCKLYVRIYEE